MDIDSKLLDFANDNEVSFLRASMQAENYTEAGALLGVHRTTVQRAVNRVIDRAALRGYAPESNMTKAVPPPFVVKRISTNYKGPAENNEVKQQWVISKPDDARRYELIRQAFETLSLDLPRLKPRLYSGTNVLNADLINVYTLTDCHVGMQAWGKETGDDWDLEIAETTLVGCFEAMMKGAANAETCVIAQLGDFLHYDGLTAITPSHGHHLDADGRFSKMVQVAIRILRRVIELALTKHKLVHVVMAEGNHDLASSVWLRHLFQALYENEPRVQLVDRECPYYALQFGKVMLAWSHGHLAKKDTLPGLFADMYDEMWGATKKRYVHCGHMHHEHIKMHAGMTVHQHPTLSARDAYAARGGWSALRQVTGLTYHRVYGQVASNTVSPEMLLAA